jgi:membrane protein implicated in regulation of membrane protease activity
VLITFLWILKDSILFFFVWPAYDWNNLKSKVNPIIGKTGIARETLYTSGYVSIDGELWNAEHVSGQGLIRAGEKVRVVHLDGLKVFVESAESDD